MNKGMFVGFAMKNPTLGSWGEPAGQAKLEAWSRRKRMMRDALCCQGPTAHIFSSSTFHVNPIDPLVLQIHEFFMNLSSDSLLHSTEGR